MNILKKTISVFLMILLIAGVFTSCGSSDTKQSDKSLQIVTTVFPAYDWTKEILGDRAEDADLTMLLDDGVDVHSRLQKISKKSPVVICLFTWAVNPMSGSKMP